MLSMQVAQVNKTTYTQLTLLLGILFQLMVFILDLGSGVSCWGSRMSTVGGGGGVAAEGGGGGGRTGGAGGVGGSGGGGMEKGGGGGGAAEINVCVTLTSLIPDGHGFH